ncbi:hypothetical protein KLP28_05730 [Nocardioidaceae bacterium]|nr:hypothetical protein KLP28_05730 [Nocardioidaceae bacterium]
MMGTCLTLIVLAWGVVRFFSTTAAVVMSLVAAVIPPIAAIVANRGLTDADNDPFTYPDSGGDARGER